HAEQHTSELHCYPPLSARWPSPLKTCASTRVCGALNRMRSLDSHDKPGASTTLIRQAGDSNRLASYEELFFIPKPSHWA
ncbi:hypothetical protein BaRGS_00032462, partial [Batillaria attramentaria]